jgi:hypothetical protein
MPIVGVYPASALIIHQRLFEQLGRFFGVEFRELPQTGFEAHWCARLIFLPPCELQTGLTQWAYGNVPTLVMNAGEEGRPGEMEPWEDRLTFGVYSPVPPALRGRELPGVGHGSRVFFDWVISLTILLSNDQGPLWVQHESGVFGCGFCLPKPAQTLEAYFRKGRFVQLLPLYQFLQQATRLMESGAYQGRQLQPLPSDSDSLGTPVDRPARNVNPNS